jgi:heme oxygenase (biliverdin-IX-beta and delta-forming)
MSVDRARQARGLFRTLRSGVLSSHSSKLPGYPYGSALPHVTDHAGRPVILISRLAEHTHNLQSDARSSLLVCEAAREVQASARATLLGNAERIAEPAAIQQRYLRFHPEHARYLEIGGFEFWTIEPLQLRFIEGFGSLHWIAAEQYLARADEIAQIEPSILEHMNADHGDALLAYCAHRYGIRPQRAQMIGFDCDGFDLRADEEVLRFSLSEPVATAQQARAALIALADQSRR